MSLFSSPLVEPFGSPFPQPFGSPGYSTLPSDGLLARFKSSILDKVGTSSRTVYPRQFGTFAVGDYLTGDIAAGTTVVSSEGDGTISLTEDRLDYTDTKDLWSFELSNGSTYECPTKTGASSGVWFDTSGNGRHLTCNVGDIDAHCGSSLSKGSNTLNQDGYSEGGIVDEELWVAPDTQTIDANNYSTFDPETGIGRIVSDGTLVQLLLPPVLIIGNNYILRYEELSKVSDGYLVYQSAIPDVLLDSGSTVFNSVADATPIVVKRGAPCDVIFKLSVKQYYPSTVPIPLLSDGSADCLGNTPTYTGRAKYDLEKVNGPCGTADGITTVITAAWITGTETITNLGTSTVTAAAGQLNFTAGTVYGLLVDDVEMPFNEAEGTTVYGYDTAGNNYTGTVTTGDIGAFWAGTQDEYFHAWEYGQGADGVPANPYTPGLDCLGRALTIQPKQLSSIEFKPPMAGELWDADQELLTNTGSQLLFDASENPQELSTDDITDGNVGNQVFYGENQIAIYDQAKVDPALTTIKKKLDLAEYIVDSDGNYITDSDGNRIEATL